MPYKDVRFMYNPPEKKNRNLRISPIAPRERYTTNSEKIREMQLFVEGILEGKNVDPKELLIAEHALLFMRFRRKEISLEKLEKHQKTCEKFGIIEAEIVAIRHVILQMEERKTSLASLQGNLKEAIKKCRTN